MPKFSASLLASSTLMSEVNLKGIIKLLTFSDPIASAAMTAVKAESMPLQTWQVATLACLDYPLPSKCHQIPIHPVLLLG